MDAPSLQRFQRDLLENQDKKALIIDERFNGGGGIDQELLEILNQRKKYQTYPRARFRGVPRPVQGYFGPMVVLAERTFRERRGNVPGGIPGPGARQSHRRSDLRRGDWHRFLPPAGRIAAPHAWFGSIPANGQKLENYGVPPDVYVDNTPADFIAGHDRQVEKAIEVLRAQMK